ncbi:MAG: helical backbone metal receptor [bacterium]
MLFDLQGSVTRSAMSPSAPASFPFQLVDATGESVSFPACPARIISLAPSITECLFSLGLDKEIIGVTTYCDYPKEAGKKEKVGSLLILDTEKILSLTPDLILAIKEGNQAAQVFRLRKLGLRVFVLNQAKELGHVYRDIGLLGCLSGRKTQAQEVIRNMRIKVREVEQALSSVRKRPLCFWQLGINPLITAGKNTLAHDLIRLAGGENLAGGQQGYIHYSLDEVIARNPEIILMIGMGEALQGYQALWEKFPQLAARKNGKILALNPDLVNRASPRIAEGLKSLAEALHPQAFVSPGR